MTDKNTSLNGDNGGFGIIGDIHGRYEAYKQLLVRLGYVRYDDIGRHSERKAIFAGDLIDRGHSREKLWIQSGQ